MFGDQFLMKYYELDGTGWGTPFLLVPEATNVDNSHLEKLSLPTARRSARDVLSKAIPAVIAPRAF